MVRSLAASGDVSPVIQHPAPLSTAADLPLARREPYAT